MSLWMCRYMATASLGSRARSESAYRLRPLPLKKKIFVRVPSGRRGEMEEYCPGFRSSSRWAIQCQKRCRGCTGGVDTGSVSSGPRT